MQQPRTTIASALVAAAMLSGCGADEGEGAASESPSESASPAADLLLEDGFAALRDDDTEAAERAFRAALDEDPDSLLAHYNLGYLAQQDGDVSTAVTRYAAALEIQDDYTPALYNLAILTEDSDLEVAVDLYRRVLDSNPDDAAAHVRLGFVLKELGRDVAGDAEIARGIELDPSLEGVTPP